MKNKIIILPGIILACWLLRPVSLDFIDLPYSTVINDKDGDLLSAQIAEDEQWRFPIIDRVPDKFENCVLVFEDKRFYSHPGIDPFSMARAIRQNIEAGRVVSGASTLTMQLARMTARHHDRSLWNKIKEVIFALRLEVWHSKNKILTWYTSLAPFGGNVVGLEAACWKYFNKQPNQLSWAQYATLAVLPNAPSLIHVNKNRELLKSKRNKLLQALYAQGDIDIFDLEGALAEPLPNRTFDLPNKAPHYLQFRKKSEGAKSYRTNIDADLQSAVGDILDQLYIEWSQNEVYNAGCIILDTKTGDVLSYHGNIPMTRHESAVDIVQARRSSGSILKPFLYAHMIDEGLMSPSAFVWDIPTYISGFSPHNYNKTFSGAVNADIALQRSLNVPAVRMLQSYGIDKLLYQLERHGILTLHQSADHYGLSLILGGGEVTLFELALAYRGLGASLINKTDDGVLSRSTIYQTFETLKDLTRPNEEGNWQRMYSRVPIAWKTGTSYGHRDAWAVGVTPEVTIATWVGNADGEGRDGIIGSSTAGRLLFSIASVLDLDGQWFDPPFEEMTFINKCSVSGMLAGPNCIVIDTIHWPMITERSPVCHYHHLYNTTLDGDYKLENNCLNTIKYSSKTFIVLPPLVAQYYRDLHPEYEPIPPLHPDCQSSGVNVAMEIVYPLLGDILYLPKDLNGVGQGLIAKVAHSQEHSRIFWYLDQEYIGVTDDFHNVTIRPSEGVHILTVVDENGIGLSREFEIVKDAKT